MEPLNLVLILARELVDKLATAMFVVEADGTLVYFNEAAGEILGSSFAMTGRMPLPEWAGRFEPTDADGGRLPPERLPLVLALKERRPAHLNFRIRALDGEARDIAVTAFPLLAHADEFVGAAAIFWQDRQADPGRSI